MSRLTRRVANAIRAGGLWGDSDRVAVALSGGADSVALTLILIELAERSRWALAGLIHVHHGLRGDESDRDAAFCRDLAARWSLPIQVAAVDVRRAQVTGRQSMEATARTLRYAALEAAAGHLGASIVATGHTADDQAETVLLRLLRGATSRGVAAVRPRRGPYARPLLAFRRQELRDWLEGRGESWREDGSNSDLRVPRNRLRAELMPGVERAWPGGVRALARFAEAAADDERWLSHQAVQARGEVVRTEDGGVELIRGALSALPVALARRVVRDALETAGGTPVFRDVERVRRLARAGRDGGCADLHGVEVRRVGDRLRLAVRAPTRTPAPFEHVLDGPGDVKINETGAAFQASLVSGAERPDLPAGWDAVAALRADSVRWPLVVRSRRSGDRLAPLGAPGRRSVQDLLVDRKVPRHRRDTVPVVVDAEGHIVWVAGVAVAERCRVRTAESGMVILLFKKGTT